ncbi:MAG: hypothetical protein Q9226_007902, partial [Calogaya cf. arnoldii]
MQNPIAKATLKSAFLSLLSSLVATFLTPKNPPILALCIYAILATPPNYLWQLYLERKFPGYDIEKREANGEVKGAESVGGGVTIKKKLNVANTLMKMVIEQTLGSVVNVALHLGIVRALQGVPVAECLQVVRTQTLPLMVAGYKLWPLVSLLNHTLIPVEQRTFVGSLQTGSPRNLNAVGPASSRFASPFSTPTASPLATTTYSPYESAKLKAPSPYGSAMHFTPRQKHRYRRYCRAALLTVKRMLLTRTTWLLVILMLTMVWWLNGGSEELGAVKLGAAGFGRDLFQGGVTQNMQFFPPSNPKIHYVGRWTPTPNRLRKDGAFPGVYFDLIIKNTTSLYLSLRNSPNQAEIPATTSSPEASPSVYNKGHLSFRPSSVNDKPAPPISLLARVDQEEYVLLPNSSSLVAICSGSLQHDTVHNIRIIAPMTDDKGRGIIQLEGIWLSKGGYFEKIEGLATGDGSSDEDPLSAQSDEVGEKHRSGLSKLLTGGGHGGRVHHQEVLQHEESRDFRDRRKNLEVITDTPGSFGGRNRGKRSGGADGLLAGVMGWEYLLGEMFGVDHTAIGVD